MWLGVDPLWEKYAGMNPYNYCAGNPVRLVDRDGREVTLNGTFHWSLGIRENINKLYQSRKSFRYIYNSVNNSGRIINVSEARTKASKHEAGHFSSAKNEIKLNVFLQEQKGGILKPRTDMSWTGGTLYEEFFHAAQDIYYKKSGQEMSGLQKEVEVKIARAMFGMFDDSNSGYIADFFKNNYGYFQILKSGKSLTEDQQIQFNRNIVNFADWLKSSLYTKFKDEKYNLKLDFLYEVIKDFVKDQQ